MAADSGSPASSQSPDAPQSVPNESLIHRWTRRLVTIPLVFSGTLLIVCALPLLLVVTALCDLVRRPPVFTRGLLFLVTCLCLESLAICGVTLLWLMNLFLRDAKWFERGNRLAQTLWTAGLYRAGERLFSMTTHIEGTIPPNRVDAPPLLVFVRHSSTADTVLPVLILAPLGYRVRYVLKRELLLDPCLDIVGQRLRNYFVARGGKETEQDLRGVEQLAMDLKPQDALVIYPEGTRFTVGKRQRILKRLRESGPADALALAESLQHTLPPLQRGPLRLLEQNRGADLLLIGHSGLEPAGSLTEMLQGQLIGQKVRVRLEHIPFASLPTDPLAQRQFLADKWKAIDAFIAESRRPIE